MEEYGAKSGPTLGIAYDYYQMHSETAEHTRHTDHKKAWITRRGRIVESKLMYKTTRSRERIRSKDGAQGMRGRSVVETGW